MPLLLLVLFVLAPTVEIYVLIHVGQAIGALPTIALLIVDAMLGSWLFKREGRRAWQAFRAALDEKRVPGKEVADGALVVLGAALLIAPGFVSDILGALCLLPPTRALLRVLLTGVVTRRLLSPAAAANGKRPASRRRKPGPEIIDGEIVDDEERS